MGIIIKNGVTYGVTDTTQIQSDITALQSGKVDKVAGKGLSTNDFTDADKTKVDNALQEAIIDVTTLPTGANIKDMVYRLATTVDNTTTYSYYMGDSVNQTTTEIPTMAYINSLNANSTAY